MAGPPGERVSPPSYSDPLAVDPMWLIDLAESNGEDVDGLREEYNLNFPSESGESGSERSHEDVDLGLDEIVEEGSMSVDDV